MSDPKLEALSIPTFESLMNCLGEYQTSSGELCLRGRQVGLAWRDLHPEEYDAGIVRWTPPRSSQDPEPKEDP